jgi:hypothetical protein
MRAALFAAALCALAADAPARYGVESDGKKYPQGTAKEALASVIKAIEAKDFRYLAAQLADPEFIDGRVKGVYAGKFAEQVEDTRSRLDALVVKQLTRLAKDGKWSEGKGGEAYVTVEGKGGKAAWFVKKGGRWFMLHRSDPPERKEP